MTFEVNTNSMFNVRATDMRTGRASTARLSIAGVDEHSTYDTSDLLMS